MSDQLITVYKSACTRSLKYIKFTGLRNTKTLVTFSATLVFLSFHHKLTWYTQTVPKSLKIIVEVNLANTEYLSKISSHQLSSKIVHLHMSVTSNFHEYWLVTDIAGGFIHWCGFCCAPLLYGTWIMLQSGPMLLMVLKCANERPASAHKSSLFLCQHYLGKKWIFLTLWPRRLLRYLAIWNTCMHAFSSATCIYVH